MMAVSFFYNAHSIFIYCFLPTFILYDCLVFYECSLFINQTQLIFKLNNVDFFRFKRKVKSKSILNLFSQIHAHSINFELNLDDFSHLNFNPTICLYINLLSPV